MNWLTAMIGAAMIVVSLRQMREGRATYRWMMGAGIVFVGTPLVSLVDAGSSLNSILIVVLVTLAVVVPWRAKVGR